jgi:hypothetical protein
VRLAVLLLSEPASHEAPGEARGISHPGCVSDGITVTGLDCFSSSLRVRGEGGGGFADRDGRSDATGSVSRPAPIAIYAACPSHDVLSR